MSSSVPAKTGGALAPIQDYGSLAGAGFENQTNADVSIPYLGVLQDLSPLVKDRSTGAIPGELFNTVTKERWAGNEGIIFQPVATEHVFVEWKPRKEGGGFVAIHSIDSALVKKVVGEQEFGKYTVNGNNDLIETYYMTGILHRSADLNEQVLNAPEPMVIAFTSTKIKVYRGINTRMRTFGNGKVPLFANRLRITTKSEPRTEGDSFNFVISPLVDGDLAKSAIPLKMDGVEGFHPLLAQGEELYKAVKGGTAKIDRAGAKGDGGTAGGKGGDDKPPF